VARVGIEGGRLQAVIESWCWPVSVHAAHRNRTLKKSCLLPCRQRSQLASFNHLSPGQLPGTARWSWRSRAGGLGRRLQGRGQAEMCSKVMQLQGHQGASLMVRGHNLHGDTPPSCSHLHPLHAHVASPQLLRPTCRVDGAEQVLAGSHVVPAQHTGIDKRPMRQRQPCNSCMPHSCHSPADRKSVV